ncbi:GDP-mannose 4,6-dehydratase [uncultured Parasutterella sp.]|uniref:GDP-mannose 4,6-dehydratase n=3 Tax=uncultured Parasutterella sp. TaxID=1263098 RepID=UPI0025DB7EF8|nr:GDP-mannose 4,6-dehydratase [uncultured Parasutterella sp.]
MKTAFITGVTGQDGAYLSELLLKKGYKVFGGVRRLSSKNLWRLDELNLLGSDKFSLVDFDLTDPMNALRVIDSIKPDEVYNLGAQSFVGVSFEQPYATAQITGLGALNLLEAIREVNSKIRYYQASTSEMFGKVQSIPQNEDTPFYPRSPYGVAKLYAHWLTVNYRESYDIFASSGILFNHESPLRGLEFVTRKITHAAAMIKAGKQDVLELGNLNAKRDWGFAGDYVEGMWRMLQADTPDTFVLATNETTTVRDFVKWAFENAGIELQFKGSGVDEVGIDKETKKVRVRVNPKFFRPAEVDLLIGNPEKSRQILGWTPSINVKQLCKMMVDADVQRVNEGKLTF